jgi:adenosine deaminase
MTHPPLVNEYLAFPKVDLHRHLEGSVRLSTVLELTAGSRWRNAAEVEAQVRVGRSDARNPATFLGKFRALREVFREPEAIRRVAREAVADAAADQVRHLELLFTPAALAEAGGHTAEAVTAWAVGDALQEAGLRGISLGMIVSINRHELVEVAEAALRAAEAWLGRGVVGCSLAGNEAEFPSAPFAGLMAEARQAGFRLTVHAGEWDGAAAVRYAIQELGAERIGHGIRILEDDAVVQLARERRIPLEVCVTSNVHSGATPSIEHHPLPRLIQAGLQVTLNTDDPGVSGVTLSDEYRGACERLGLSRQTLVALILAASQAAFLDRPARADLERRLWAELEEATSGRPRRLRSPSAGPGPAAASEAGPR